MIKILESSTPTCLVARFSGNVTGEEYELFTEAAKERLQVNDQIGLVLDLSEFDLHADLKASWDDFKFGVEDYRHFSRTALVGDQKWIGRLTRWFGPLTHAEEKQFAAGQLEEALAWAKNAQ